MAGRLLAKLLLVVFPAVIHGCILLLNGWQPKSLEQRARAAEIVLTAYTRDAFKEHRTNGDTYTAEFLILNVLKGDNQLKNVVHRRRSPLQSALGQRLVNVSNFGDKTMCYSDVNAGETYILFLTTFEGRLSAKYDDIFGAAVLYSRAKEDEVLRSLGWRPWGEWTSCSATCGGGLQQRRRLCNDSMTCPRTEGEQRTCNMFPCSDSVDVLSVVNLRRKSHLRPLDRPTAFTILSSSAWATNAKNALPPSFPFEFSLVATLRLVPATEGYLMGVYKGKSLQLGLYVGERTSFVFSAPQDVQVSFVTTMADGKWHQMAFSVRENRVTFYLDCKEQGSQSLSGRIQPIPDHSLLVVGNLVKPEEDDDFEPFQGAVEQLVIMPNPNSSQEHCSEQTQSLMSPHRSSATGTQSLVARPLSNRPLIELPRYRSKLPLKEVVTAKSQLQPELVTTPKSRIPLIQGVSSRGELPLIEEPKESQRVRLPLIEETKSFSRGNAFPLDSKSRNRGALPLKEETKGISRNKLPLTEESEDATKIGLPLMESTKGYSRSRLPLKEDSKPRSMSGLPFVKEEKGFSRSRPPLKAESKSNSRGGLPLIDISKARSRGGLSLLEEPKHAETSLGTQSDQFSFRGDIIDDEDFSFSDTGSGFFPDGDDEDEDDEEATEPPMKKANIKEKTITKSLKKDNIKAPVTENIRHKAVDVSTGNPNNNSAEGSSPIPEIDLDDTSSDRSNLDLIDISSEKPKNNLIEDADENSKVHKSATESARDFIDISSEISEDILENEPKETKSKDHLPEKSEEILKNNPVELSTETTAEVSLEPTDKNSEESEETSSESVEEDSDEDQDTSSSEEENSENKSEGNSDSSQTSKESTEENSSEHFEEQESSKSKHQTDIKKILPNIPTEDLFEGSGSSRRFELEWSDWSPCSTTCGWGRRTRTSYCIDNGVHLEECIEAGEERKETESCFKRICPTPSTTIATEISSETKCTQECKNGGSCNSHNKCSCLSGYNGDTCEEVTCRPNCKNGGLCNQPNKCTCPKGYTGKWCETAICSSGCHYGGLCIQPEVCRCPMGYTAPSCAPICIPSCRNGGKCVAPGKCRCDKGYFGKYCEKVVCSQGCKNGGRCVAPDHCICTSGYTGNDCGSPKCDPPCQNGGVCLKPYFCHCPSETRGSFCEKFSCYKECLHGGKCVGPNQCACLRGYRGRYCEEVFCPGGCMNGGKCLKPGKCKCITGYSGSKCEFKKCRYIPVIEPYQRGYKQKVTTTEQVPCGAWGWKQCTKTKVHYEMVYKTFHRTSYKCSSVDKEKHKRTKNG